MQIIELKDIVRKDHPIYYRRFYTGTIVMEILSKTVERHIDFSVEIMPTGKKEINVTFDQPVDYPMVPLLKKLKTYIDDFDRSGGLPV
ncbi:hypothetical protein [Breznakiella homolactica]|uniref:Uncharacterized protein n=1 Tax=Breznakiella homolactica TaxID=2798577 RepID=A0A7T7XJE5_9SPIR|nr:hypothetical protein [Breznakiella homolactica]QQO07529.1 hypothetical protein JFL75_11265 [Breznakiella homolactica]